MQTHPAGQGTLRDTPTLLLGTVYQPPTLRGGMGPFYSPRCLWWATKVLLPSRDFKMEKDRVRAGCRELGAMSIP